MAIKTIKEESLTALGNAIRIKTGNENLLEFPNGMVNAISGIETSGAIEALDIAANGVYNAPEGVDGYNPITVAVPERVPVVESKEIILLVVIVVVDFMVVIGIGLLKVMEIKLLQKILQPVRICLNIIQD